MEVFLIFLGVYTRLLLAKYRDKFEGGLYPYKNTAQIHYNKDVPITWTITLESWLRGGSFSSRYVDDD